MDRFWNKVEKTDTCWNWTAGTNSGGYGQIQCVDKLWKAHRMSYLLHHGTIDGTLKVLHKCDNKLCVNPDHLIQGTQKENIYDMIRKGRANSGGLTKLNYEIAEEIRKGYEDGLNQYQLADKYGVSQSQISNIILGKRWGAVYAQSN